MRFAPLLATALLWSSAALADVATGFERYAPVELYRHQPDAQGRGLDWATANRMCRIQQELNDHRFYTVFCTFEESERTRLELGLERREEYRLLGYRASESFDRVWGIVTRTNAPVFGVESVPVLVPNRLIRSSVYAVVVWGLGDFRTLPWITLDDSAKVGEFELPLFFQSRGLAALTCRRILVEKQYGRQQLRYRKARCQVRDHELGRYFYRIEVQSPFEVETLEGVTP